MLMIAALCLFVVFVSRLLFMKNFPEEETERKPVREELVPEEEDRSSESDQSGWSK